MAEVDSRIGAAGVGLVAVLLTAVAGCRLIAPAAKTSELGATYDMGQLLAAHPTTFEGMKAQAGRLHRIAEAVRHYPTDNDAEADRRDADADKLLERSEHWSRKAIATRPGHHDGYVALGDSLAEQGEHDEAMKAYEEALRRNPKHADTHHAMGVLLFEQADEADEEQQKQAYAAARSRFEQRLAIEPKSAEAHHYVAVAAHHEGDLDKARKHYEHVLKTDPNHDQAKLNLALVLAHKDGDLAAAIRHWNEIAALDSSHVRARSNLARVAIEKKQYNEAVRHWLAAAQGDAKDPRERALRADAWYRLAMLYEHMIGDHAEAAAAAEKAVNLQPQNLQYRHFLRRIHRKILRTQ